MNSFISPASFDPISSLLRKREEQMRTAISSLRAIDVSTEEHFAKYRNMMKKALLLEPIVFRKPELISRGYGHERPAGQRDTECFIHRIAFQFTGSRALFDYTPETFGYRQADKGLVRPTNNSVVVEVSLAGLHLQKAVLEARNLLSLTMQFISSNNAVATTWSKDMEIYIDRELGRKRLLLSGEMKV
jgi:hypothetical protein